MPGSSKDADLVKMEVKDESDEDDMDAVEAQEIKVPAEVTELNENKDEIRLFEEAAKAQAAKLAELKAESSSSSSNGSAESTADKRLNYLLRQSEVFAHFLGNEDASAGAGRGGKRSSSSSSLKTAAVNRRGRMKEEDEDRRMMQMAQKGLNVVRLTKQPRNITGSMRAYQLEGLNWMIKLHDNTRPRQIWKVFAQDLQEDICVPGCESLAWVA